MFLSKLFPLNSDTLSKFLHYLVRLLVLSRAALPTLSSKLKILPIVSSSFIPQSGDPACFNSASILSVVKGTL